MLRRSSKREATAVIAERLASLHIQEIGRDEPSAILGFPFVLAFYKSILASENAKVFYTVSAGGEIVSFCCLFTNYQKFNFRFLPMLFFIAVKEMFFFRIGFGSFIRLRRSLVRTKPVSDLKFHLGMIVRNSTFGPAAINDLSKNIRKAISYAVNNGAKSIWASARQSNVKSVRFLQSIGFVKVAECSRGIIFILLCGEEPIPV